MNANEFLKEKRVCERLIEGETSSQLNKDLTEYFRLHGHSNDRVTVEIVNAYKEERADGDYYTLKGFAEIHDRELNKSALVIITEKDCLKDFGGIVGQPDRLVTLLFWKYQQAIWSKLNLETYVRDLSKFSKQALEKSAILLKELAEANIPDREYMDTLLLQEYKPTGETLLVETGEGGNYTAWGINKQGKFDFFQNCGECGFEGYEHDIPVNADGERVCPKCGEPLGTYFETYKG